MVQVGLKNFALQHQVGKLTLSNDRNEPRRLQLFHMMRESGCAHWLALAHVCAANPTALCANLLQNFVATRISQGLCDQTYLPLWKYFSSRHCRIQFKSYLVLAAVAT